MYKVEIKFNFRGLTPDTIDWIYEQTDQIFKKEDLNCGTKEPGKRVYFDKGRQQDYGRFWAAIFALKSSEKISSHIQECYWYNGNERENLITDFMRN